MNRHGFTLAELLLVILVLSLLTVITLSSLVSLQVDIIMTDLNFKARSVFLSSQHRLVYMSSSGTLDFLEDIRLGKNSLYYVVLTPDAPSLIDMSFLLNVSGGKSVIVEFKLGSACVTGVYYSETMSAGELETVYLTQDIQDALLRRKLRIGYYGGDTVDKPPREHTLAPRITVVNGEDLFLEITCDDIPSAIVDSFSLEVTLSNGTIETTLSAYKDIEIINGIFTARVLIDTMYSDIPFAQKYPEFGFSDVTAYVRIIYHGENGDEMTPDQVMSERAVTFNPLFESKAGDSITVAKVRHLNNLRYINTRNLTVTQTADIAFKNAADTEFFYPMQRDLSVAPIHEFKGVFDGNDFLIKNVSLDPDADTVGLFKTVSGELRNIHLTGTTTITTSADTVGTLCGRLTASGRIYNCSVSEMTISAGDGATVGGLVGVSEGEITHCSAVLDDVSLGQDSTAGGIVGRLAGGSVAYSHSAGKFTSSEASLICGIASGTGDIKNCYSECTTGYISGSDFYGIAKDTADIRVMSGSYIIENAWLALDTGRAVERKNLSISGFTSPRDAYINSDHSVNTCDLPESVTKNGIETRFGSWDTPSPRGLIGLLEVTYDGENFIYSLIHSFDAYGNDSVLHPEITWSAPKSGETRRYLFRSVSVSPIGGSDGWEWKWDGELGEEERHGNYICQQMIGSGEVSMRFGSITKTAEFYGETILEGVVGVLTVLYGEWMIDGETWEPVPYTYNYRYMDAETGVAKTYEKYNYKDRLTDLEEFEFSTANDGEIRIYLFSSKNLEFRTDWTADIDDSDLFTTFDFASYTLHEVFRGDSFDVMQFNISLSDGKELYARIELMDDAFSQYCIPMISGHP